MAASKRLQKVSIIENMKTTINNGSYATICSIMCASSLFLFLRLNLRKSP